MKKIVFFSLLSFVSIHAFSQLNIQFRSQLTYPGLSLANIWGYVDSLGNEYALVGTSAGVSIVDVTNPNTPVQKFAVSGTNSQWREIKTWGKYAYVTTEGCCLGLQIINLSNLPGSVTSSYWTGSGAIAGQLQRAHSLHIDNGYLYLNGSNLFNGACIIASLSNPVNPTYMSNTMLNFTGNTRYVHDCYVRNDTLFGANIYAGMFTIINVANKSLPVLINTQNTTNSFTHNCWLTDNSRVLLTTDETSNSFLTAYDISNPGNITYLDKVQSNPGSNSIVHNTYVRNDYAITSWYKDGLAIVDVSRPENMIITGTYDTYSQGAGNGFNGCWGVYPYLPSGNILASDINNGLYVLTPTYVRACYLEGQVTNSCNGVGLSNVTVQITGGNIETSTITGAYKTGVAVSGNYTVTFSKTGYTSVVLNNVALSNGTVTSLNVALVPVGGISAVNPVVQDVHCNGESNGQITISPAGGVLPLTFLWTNGSTSQNIIGVTAGTYKVTVTDATGCTLTSQNTINQPPPLNPAPVSNSPVCKGSTLTFNSPAGFSSYSWTGPLNYSSINQNNTIANSYSKHSGTYTLVVTDVTGCSNAQSITVQVSEITVTQLVTQVQCFNTSSGSIDLAVTGGIGAYAYNWNTGALIQDLFSIPAGSYSVTITDAIGCTRTASYLITQAPSALVLSTSKTNARCYGSSTGQATVNPTGGLIPYMYSWNTNPVKTTPAVSGLGAGSYIATVTDVAGCTKTKSIAITQPAQYLQTGSQSNVTVYGGNDGTATVSASGGTPSYSYTWNTVPAQSTTSISNLTAGVYKCKVTDSKGCTLVAYFTITQPSPVRYHSDSEIKYPRIYPNPVIDFLNIQNLDDTQQYLFTFYDVQGRLILNTEIIRQEFFQIALDGIETGIYFAEIKTVTEKHTYKVIKR